MPQTITVYSKPSCPQCTATTRALQALGVEYLYVDLSQDAAAVQKVLALGYKQAPVVVTEGDHWCGFRPDKLSELAAMTATKIGAVSQS